MTAKCEGTRMKFVWKTRMKVQRSLNIISFTLHFGTNLFWLPRISLPVNKHYQYFSRPQREVVTTEIFTSGTQCICGQKTRKNFFFWVKCGICSVSECCAGVKYLSQNSKTVKILLCSTDVTRVATLIYIINYYWVLLIGWLWISDFLLSASDWLWIAEVCVVWSNWI